MKKISTLILISCGIMFFAPRAKGQDTSRVRHPKQVITDEDSEDDAPQPAQKKKRAAAKMHDAPVCLGIAGGLNDATLIIGGNGSGAKYGPVLGGVMDIHLVGVLHLETGLYYAMTGGSNIYYQDAYTGQFVSGYYVWTVHTLEVPLTFEFKFGKPGHARFCLGLGGYVGYNIAGSLSPGDINGGTLKIGSDGSDDLKALDLGVAIDIGLQLKSGLFFRIRGQGGISDLEPKQEELGTYVGTIRTSCTRFEVGYLFNNGKKSKSRHGADDRYLEPKM